MAEATGLRNNALPYPVYGVPFGIEFPILDADGDLVTGATGLDSERSLNGDTFADCTNEATEIATSSGMYYLLLTAAEMTADVVAVIVKTSSSGAKTTVLTLYPRKLVALRSGTAQGGAAGYITLDASAGAKDDIWNGCLCVATIDSNVEARIISDYTGSSKQAAVSPSWNVTPDSDDTFIVYLPEGRQINEANVTAASSADLTAATIPTAAQIRTEMDSNSTKLASIETDTQDIQTRIPDALTNGYIKSHVNQMGTNAVNATALAADAVAEIQSGLATQTSVDDLPTNAELATALGTADDAILSRLGTPSGASVSADIAAIKAETVIIKRRAGFLMAQEIGACADPQTSGESYTITIDTNTYTIDHTSLDSSGTRGTAVLTES